VENYPRGKDFLQSAFRRFQPKDMIQWLEDRGVDVKVEKDGRCFPVANTSQAIIDCLLTRLKKTNVTISLEKEVMHLKSFSGGWEVVLKDESIIQAKKVVFTTGGLTRSYSILEELGHKMVKPIPSLFTLELKEDWIKELSGSVVPMAKVSLEGAPFAIQGPMLITHFGLSGPAILKLSAFAARWFFDVGYLAKIFVNWTGINTHLGVKEAFYAQKKASSEKKIALTPLFSLSKKLWRELLQQIAPSSLEKTWAQISRQEIDRLTDLLYQMPLSVIGKSTNKEEFVTCGGVPLEEVYPKTMESRIAPGIYFAGEVLNVDGVTGGFNFQNAWTTAWIAAHAINESI
ncbi:MAG: aminoacetone oxidase family FAD-binding enzyme, partial [Verrucomicrobia bacterium]|nr:aminoacetone oxidase family FAD-binding enzyme [Verrucomicrobiota bacterium]